MLLARILLVLNGLAFAGYGVACLISPSLPADYAGLEFARVSGLVEVTAMYGGLQIGVGVLLLASTRSATWTRVGLVILGVLLASLALGRATGLAVQGEGDAYNLGAIGYESLCALLAFLALRALPDLAPAH